MAVAATANAGLEVEGSQKGDPFVTGELTPFDGNARSSAIWVCAAMPLLVTLGGFNPCSCRHPLTNQLAGAKQLDDDCQKKPALLRTDVSNNGYPDHIGCSYIELTGQDIDHDVKKCRHRN
jgi:hypothetical protein